MQQVLDLIEFEFSSDYLLGGRGLLYITKIGDVRTSIPLHRIVIRDQASNTQITVATANYADTLIEEGQFINPRMCIIPEGMSQAEWIESITEKLVEAYNGSSTYQVSKSRQHYAINYGVKHTEVNSQLSPWLTTGTIIHKSLVESITV